MQAQFFDLYRNGMKTAAEFAKASLENTVRLQQKQLDMVRTILEENARSADRLGEAKSVQDFFSLQSQLGRAGEMSSSAVRETARSSEEVARVAAAQISRAAGSLRESGAPQERKEPHRKSA